MLLPLIFYTIAMLAASTDWGIAIATITISLASLLLAVIMGSRRLTSSASSEWVRILEKRVEMCEQDRGNLHQKLVEVQKEFEEQLKERDNTIAKLERQELALMRRLTRLEDQQ